MHQPLLPAAETEKKPIDVQSAQNPPRPPLILRVGVTADGPDATMPDANVQRLRTTIRAVLQQIAESVSGVGDTFAELFAAADEKTGKPLPSLRLVSALTPGAVQWTAEEALDLEYELQFALPMARAGYGRCLAGDAAKYSELLNSAKTTAVLELDGALCADAVGCREPSCASREAAGRVVLQQSDLLIAVWDGKDDQGRGESAQMVNEALQRGIPVVWVRCGEGGPETAPSPGWSLLRESNDLTTPSHALTQQVHNLLVPAVHQSGAHAAGDRDLRREYFHETLRAWHPGLWMLFRDMVSAETVSFAAIKSLPKAFRARPLEVASEWRCKKRPARSGADGADLESAYEKNAQQSERTFSEPYAWADYLSDYHAGLYRSSFVLNFLLSAGAVLFALSCVVAPPHGLIAIVGMIAEFLSIVFILLLTIWGRHRRWHQRWIDYRTLAERLRLARCLMLLGGGGQQASLAAHLASYGNPTGTWMHWYYMAFERAAGLPDARFDEPYLRACKDLWCDCLLDDQVKYHAGVVRRLTKIERRLHRFGVALFITTLFVCVAHLVAAVYANRAAVAVGAVPSAEISVIDATPPGEQAIANPALAHVYDWTRWLTLFAAFLPALGAALAAIRSQAELHRVAQRSSAMHERLADMHLALASTPCRPDELNSVRLREIAQRISTLMIDEMLDWRVVFQDRPLVLPA